MDLKTYLKNLGSLTERERELVIDAWIEASGVFDDGTTRDAQLRIGADDAGQICPSCKGEGIIRRPFGYRRDAKPARERGKSNRPARRSFRAPLARTSQKEVVMSEDNKTYTLKEVREKFFPNFVECRCGGFHPKGELIQCSKCKEYFCEHCWRRHNFCISLTASGLTKREPDKN